MIKIKLASIGPQKEKEQDLQIKEGESAFEAVDRALDLIKITPKGKNSFQFLVNGVHIDRELSKHLKLKSTDFIVIAPKLSGGDDTGSLIKTAALIAITVYTGGAGAALFGAGTVGAALFTAGVTIGASLLLNSLIPPPVPEGLNLGSVSAGDSGGFSSQMYSLSGQSNQARKFNFVPKVYGTHRMFPVIASNPYTELETDSESGQLVQYFYGIYDFGFGPGLVTDLKIGETPISNFSDVDFRFVDLNKPITSEGVWDDQTNRSFEIYKGALEQENVSVALNKNLYDIPTPAVETWQAIRNTATNTDGLPAEISLTFVCPKGLYCFSATGQRDYREIGLEVHFQRIGDPLEAFAWKGYNDLNAVQNFKVVGGNEAQDILPATIAPPTDSFYAVREAYGSGFIPIDISGNVAQPATVTKYFIHYIPAHTNRIVMEFGDAQIGWAIIHGTRQLGIITAIEDYIPGYKYYVLDRPLFPQLDLYTSTEDFLWNGSFTSLGPKRYYEPTTGNFELAANTSREGRMKVQRISYAGVSIKRNETSPVYASVKFTPKAPGQYRVRVVRTRSSSPHTSTIADELSWIGLSTRFAVPPIVTDKRHIFLEIKIRATNQLSGSLQTLSGVVNSAIDVYNGSSWVKQISTNPAWIFADLLTGEHNKRAISKTRLHTPSLLEWSQFCDEAAGSPQNWGTSATNRFRCSFILDFPTTLQSILNKVANAAQASINMIDGKYGVLIDKLRTTPVQIFTPRNSWGFTSTRNYTRQPHGVTVSYIDPSADWDSAEITVYDNGYNETTATQVDEISSFGVTNPEQAWRYGRYLLAQNRLRQENITITVDFEHLVCTRGDYVQITQDVMKVGGSPARVKSRTGNQIVIDDGIETGPFSYGFVFRGADGSIVEDTLTVISSDTFDLDGSLFPEPGDLIVIGVVDEIVFDCLVKSISPNSDLSASITLVEKADGIYAVETEGNLPDYTPNISITQDSEFGPPGEVVDLVIADNLYRCIAGAKGIEYYITLDWDVPTGSAFDVYEVYLNYGKGYDLLATIKESIYTHIVPTKDLGVEHKFRVLAVSATGKKLDLGTVSEVSATPLIKTTPPSDVESLNIDITGETLQLFWPAIPDCDLNEYLIRYSPNINDTWETSVPLLRIGGNSTLTSTQARTGIYLIKAIDLTGNESENSRAAITTIPNLFGLNVIDEVSDFPALNGTFDRTVDDGGGGLLLRETVSGSVSTTEYEPEGYYYYENFLDLGEIYTVRLQSKIRAEGYTLQDLMSNWVTLSSVTAMTTSGFSDWDVEAQYRTTESFNVMADWVTLASIDPLSEGQQDLWTEWKKFIIGDATGRIFQFRLKLISSKVSVTPRVFDGTIRSDMPDRVESYNNIAIPGGGDEILHSPAFKGPGTTPNIQVSMENGEAGDYWTFDYKTLDGFYIRFFDSGDNPVARTADFQVKGYGRKSNEII